MEKPEQEIQGQEPQEQIFRTSLCDASVVLGFTITEIGKFPSLTLSQAADYSSAIITLIEHHKSHIGFVAKAYEALAEIIDKTHSAQEPGISDAGELYRHQISQDGNKYLKLRHDIYRAARMFITYPTEMEEGTGEPAEAKLMAANLIHKIMSKMPLIFKHEALFPFNAYPRNNTHKPDIFPENIEGNPWVAGMAMEVISPELVAENRKNAKGKSAELPAEHGIELKLGAAELLISSPYKDIINGFLRDNLLQLARASDEHSLKHLGSFAFLHIRDFEKHPGTLELMQELLQEVAKASPEMGLEYSLKLQEQLGGRIQYGKLPEQEKETENKILERTELLIEKIRSQKPGQLAHSDSAPSPKVSMASISKLLVGENKAPGVAVS